MLQFSYVSQYVFSYVSQYVFSYVAVVGLEPRDEHEDKHKRKHERVDDADVGEEDLRSVGHLEHRVFHRGGRGCLMPGRRLFRIAGDWIAGVAGGVCNLHGGIKEVGH